MPQQRQVSFPLESAYDLQATMALSALGFGDPSLRQDPDGRVRVAFSLDSSTLAIELAHDRETVKATVTGAQADWAIDMLPGFLGLDYEPPELNQPRRLKALSHKFRGLRLTRAPLLFPRIVQTVLQQLVSYQDACHGWRELVTRYGERVSEFNDLWAPPTPERLSQLASFQFIECGILPEHGRRIVGLAKVAKRLETKWAAGRDADARDDVCKFLAAQRGIGPWTIGYLRGGAMADSDAVVLKDYGMPKQVAYFFGEEYERATDDDMLRLLEPYQPHRFYVLALLLKSGVQAPRRGPRHRLLKDHMGVRRRRGRRE